MLKKVIVIMIACFGLVSCNFFKSADIGNPIARVNDSYLYKSDIEGLVAKGTSKEDSILMVNNFITRWATQLLLLDGSERNLPERKQEEFNKLVDQYKKDLFTKTYIEALVKKSIDTTISADETKEIYEKNRETFKLNEDLIKLRYINLPLNSVNKEEIEKRFRRYSPKDQVYFDSISVQFKSYSLNDSIWIKLSQVAEKIPVVTSQNRKELLKKSNFIQLKDSLDLYLIQINDVLFQNDNAPLEYVKPTIKQILINKRKLELIKQLEKDITKDAIKNNQFEIYNQN